MKKIFTLCLSLATLGVPTLQADTFLKASDMPAGENYLPNYAADNDIRFWGDWVQYCWGKSIRNTARGEQARTDADTSTSNFCSIFSKVFGITLSSSKTPEIYKLMDNVRRDADQAATSIKKKYMRTRPYVKFEEPTLVPSAEESLRTNGSYPSGHTTQGWALAMVLVEINPAHQEEILARAYEYGQSRVIAGFHWQSDVDGGRCIAAAAIARLHADAAFAAQLKKAKEEYAKKTGSSAKAYSDAANDDFDFNSLPTGEDDK